MKAILSRLYEHERLSREEARSVLLEIAREEYNPVQIASFITVYNLRPVSVAELQGFRDALLELCVPLDLDGLDTLDIVGTGGDGKNTFNISTLSAVVIAGAGYPVAKHGSYSVSSSVGSSNVLLALGYEFTNEQAVLRRQLDAANLCFLHAPLFHPALKAVAPVRKQLGMRSFFNMLGPLVNPVQPRFQLFGTSSLELSRLYQYIMQDTGRRFAIVHALDGYDEVSLTGPFKVHTNEGEHIFVPEDIGQPRFAPVELYGGTSADEAAAIFRDVLNNEATPAQTAVVAANAGLAIQCIKPGQALEDCIAEAAESLHSGRAAAVFRKLVD